MGKSAARAAKPQLGFDMYNVALLLKVPDPVLLADMLFTRAKLAFWLQHFTMCVADCDAALTLDCSLVTALSFRARAFEGLHDFENALEVGLLTCPLLHSLFYV